MKQGQYIKDIVRVGDISGRLTVVEIGLRRSKCAALMVRCECGNEKTVQTKNVWR